MSPPDPSIVGHAGPRRRWPAGFAGLLGIVLLVECAIALVGRDLGLLMTADWRRTPRDASGRTAAGAEILCFGDSLIKTGIVPAAIEARLDQTAYNLAALGVPSPGSYFLLNRALAAGARPRAIIYDANESLLWLTSPRECVTAWADLIGPADALELARDDGDPGFFGLYLVHHLIPSVRLRHDLRRAIGDILAGRAPTMEIPYPRVVDRQHAANRGAILYQPMHPKDGPDHRPGGALGPDEAPSWYTGGWTARPSNLLYVDKFLALAASRGIPVFLLVAPIHPGVLAERERRGLHVAYDAFLRDLLDRHPHVVVVDGRHAGFGHGAFVDACHLQIEGALALSQGLADVIAARLDAPDAADRWVSLPPYAEPTARLAVEDVVDSVKALIVRDALRR